MTTAIPTTALQLRSLVRPAGETGELELTLAEIPVPQPASDEVLIRMEAAPINPSDLGMLFGAADMSAAKYGGTPASPVVTAPISEAGMRAMAARVGLSAPVGNEGAGLVVAAGDSAAAQALVGQTVAVLGGAMFSQYRCVKAAACLVLSPHATAAEGASCFVNPLTALGMVETMRLEGHSALVHTAAASNLGQMLQRICLKDGIPLVNVVRRHEQASMLRKLGAQYVCDTSAPTFMQDLFEALEATGATIAFDATGGGTLAGQLLGAMEAAAVARGAARSMYGTTVHKQVYIYGLLDHRPVTFQAGFGFAWSMGGWLLSAFMNRVGLEKVQALRTRVVTELKTTFASHYTQTVSLQGMLKADAIAVYGKRATGEKFLVNPNLESA
ncbi:MAG: zinc-binding dehydrogenase [Vicinamibacterales bacterium]